MKRQARSLESPGRRPSGATAALAARLGLSRWAVSRALNGQPGVSAETAARVRAEAERGGFAPSVLARGLRAGGTALAGICLPDPETFFLSGRLVSLAEELAGFGYGPVFQISDGSAGSEARALNFFSGIGCRAVGVFAARLGVAHPAVEGLLGRGVRVVHVDPVRDGLGVAGVASDRATAMRLVVRYLHDRGFRSACLAGIDAGGAYGRQRLRGLAAEAARCGWKNPPEPLPPINGVDDYAEGEALADLHARGRWPRAVIARNDRVAFGFAARSAALGRVAPRDFVLAGYDATPLARMCRPGFVSVDPGHARLAGCAARMLAGEMPACGITKIPPGLVG